MHVVESTSARGTTIHPAAIVDPHAELGRNVVIGPFAVIGPNVRLGDDVQVGPSAVIDGRTTIGARTRISAFASIGSKPQDLKYRGEETALEIGEENQFREYSNISIGTAGGGGVTKIGNRNLFMVYSHIAHDCRIGNDCIFVNSVAIAGHVQVGDHSVFGGLSAAHQFCRIGDLAMIAGGAMVTQDVPPYCMVQGDRAAPNGLNVVGLRRAGITGEEFTAVKTMYRMLYNENLALSDTVARIETEVPESKYRNVFVEFLRKSERGVCR